MNLLLNNFVINAFGWTLIHSLWIGLAAAILAGLTLSLTKKANSATRYNLLAALSILFLVAIGFIFNNEIQTESSDTSTGTWIETNQPSTHFIAATLSPKMEEERSLTTIIASFITTAAPWMVMIWMLVFLFKCVRMTGDLRHVYRARNFQTALPSDEWVKRLSQLQFSLKINRQVQLLESKLVNVPSVTGFIKPIILIPAGMLNNIPQDQVEAILLHELAHIRRNDYLINFVQTFIEMLFFFNPGILWISTLLKEERENCCDDLAISVTKNKREFVNALVSFQEHHLQAQSLALQFSDQKMDLANRAKRILFNTNKAFSIREKYFLSASMAVATILILVVINVNATSAQEVKATSKQNTSGSQFTINSTDDSIQGVEFQDIDLSEEERIIEEASKIIEQHSAKIEAYSAIIEKHSAAIEQYSVIIEEQGKILEAEAKKPANKINWKRHDEAQKRIEAEQAKIEIEQAKIEVEQVKIEAESKKINQQSIIIDEQSRKIDAKVKLQDKEIQRIEAIQQKQLETILSDIKAAGYNGKIKSFDLSENALLINGKKQSDELFQKIKKHIQPGMRITHHFDSH